MRSAGAAVTVVVLVILVAANVLAAQSGQAWDLTRAHNNTLEPQSVLAAKGLSSDVHVIGLFRPGVVNGQMETEALIALYQGQSSHVKYRTANPDTDTADVGRYGVTEVDTVVLDYGGRTRLLLQGSQSEQDFTSALLELESGRTPMVCWAVGDGERDLKDSNVSTGYSGVANLLSKNSFASRDLQLEQQASIPADCDELAILDPAATLSARAVGVVDAFLAGGGRLLVAAEPWPQNAGATASLNALLQPYGLGFTGGLVLETDPARYAAQDPTVPAIVDYGQSPISREIQGVVSFFPRATAIAGTPAAGATVVRVAVSTAGAYAIARVRSNLPRQATDASGPFTLMETLQQPALVGKTRIVLVGTQAFAENRTLPPQNSDANLELALGSFQWLAGEDALVNLPAKPARAVPITLTQDEKTILLVITSGLMPGLIVVAGLAVWWRRRVR